MDFADHLRTTLSALRNWLVARAWNALIVGTLWWVGLAIIRVPWAPLWGLFGGLLQFIPNFGAMLALIGPEFICLVTTQGMKMIYVLILYAFIAVLDGLVLDPLLMKRTARVPIWASIPTPIVLGILWPFWGVVVSAPLLAVIFAFLHRGRNPRRDLHLPAP
jgi:predicted PurR-regulated permease PerM